MAFSTLKRLFFMFIDLFFLLYIRMIMELNTTNNINSLLEPDDDDEEEYFDCEDNEEYFNHENDEEFTFMYLDENNTPIPADKALKNKDIHPIFPLFDQNLLSHEERKQLLPINPQVNKVFVESDQVALSSTSAYDRIESVAMGPYCTRKKQPPKLSKKSNSTCFPKLWRLKDKVGCSNSDGRDAFVFLKKPVRSAVEGSSLKGNGGKRKGLKAENGKFSGHEVCLRSMGPFCMWRKQPPKLSKKSNSTCFSKLWRLKDKVGCSNSDGPSRYQNACARVRHTPINEPVPSQAPLTGHCHQQMIEEPLPSKTIKRAMAKLPNRPQKIQALANRFINRKDRNEQIYVASPDGMYDETFYESVEYESLLGWMTNDWIDGTILHWWCMHLFEMVSKEEFNPVHLFNPTLSRRVCESREYLASKAYSQLLAFDNSFKWTMLEIKYSGVGAAIEYAVLHLKSKEFMFIVQVTESSTILYMTSDFIEDWVKICSTAKSKVQAEFKDLNFAEQCTKCEMEAVNVSLGNLLSYPFVKAAVMNKTLSLKGGYYNFVKCSFDTWSLDYGVSPSLAVK
ncbi:carbonic anhydrase 2-like protein [Tanacetum coccineum]